MSTNLASVLPSILPRAITWAEDTSQFILQQGQPLDAVGSKLARAVGVAHPDRIRIWTVPTIPLPKDPDLERLAREQNLIGPGTRGMTLGYGILIKEGEMDLALLSHECRHVHQVEIAGGLAAFLPAYLKEVANYGYDNAPYELDARAHEIRACWK